MKIEIRSGLPFVRASLIHCKKEIELDNVLLDTGSSGTIFSADKVLGIGLRAEPDDTVHRIRGVGGSEFVFIKQIDAISLGEFRIEHFNIEVGSVNYGFKINGIAGIDFLLQTKAIIDLDQLMLFRSKRT